MNLFEEIAAIAKPDVQLCQTIYDAFVSKDQGLISEATYMNYKYNRNRAPEISAKDWEIVFGDTTQMEERMQRELKG